jgi:hypothetical protein
MSRRPSPTVASSTMNPGPFHPRHRHDFAQLWHILEGTFKVGDPAVGPGPWSATPRPVRRDGRPDVVRDTGPHMARGPIYHGRFHMRERKPLLAENPTV